MKKLAIIFVWMFGIAAALGQFIGAGKLTGSGAITKPNPGTFGITTSSLADGIQSSTYGPTQAQAEGGTPCGSPSYHWIVSSGSLPAGLSLSDPGVFSGTPATPGISNFQLQVTDCSTPTPQVVFKNFSLNIHAPASPPAITTTSLPSATVGVAYSQPVNFTGGTGPYSCSLSAGSLPAWATMTLSGLSCLIAGTPNTTPGTVNFTVLVTDANAQFSAQPLSITTNPASVPPSITTASCPNATSGSSYLCQLSATGGLQPYAWNISAGSLPVWASLNTSTGAITGTASGIGTSSFTARVTDSNSLSNTKPLSITTISPPTPPTIATLSLPNAIVNVNYNQPVQFTGGTAPFACSISAGSLPAWATMTLSGNTCVISGLPNAISNASFTVQVTDTNSLSGTQALSIATVSSSAPGENDYCAKGDVPNFGVADGPATLPTRCLYTGTDGTPAPGGTVTLGACTASALQNALAALTVGQTIVIPAACSGASAITGNFTLPVVSGADINHWNWIITDQTGAAGFPAEHTRVTPCAINQASVAFYDAYPCPSPATLLPTLQSGSTNVPVFTTATGAHFWRMVGLNIKNLPGTTIGNALVLATNADHILLDRVIIGGTTLSCSMNSSRVYACNGDEVDQGMNANNSTYMGIISSWGHDIYSVIGKDTQLLIAGNGTATNQYALKLWNDEVAAAGESFIFGGGGSSTTPVVTPCDIEFRQNHFFKPLSWFLAVQAGGTHPVIKNNGEFKNGCRGLIEGNIFENSIQTWQSDQSGFNMLLTPKNQSNPQASGTTTCDAVGNCVANTGTFPSSLVAASCATPNHCLIKLNGSGFRVNTWTDTTHISLQTFPAAGSYTFVPFATGLNPNAVVHDVTVRYNELRNSTNGMQVGSITSDGGDASLGVFNLSIHDLLMHGVNAQMTNGGSQGITSCVNQENTQPSNNLNTITYDHLTCAQMGLGQGNSGLITAWDSQTNTTTGSSGLYFPNMIYRNSIGSSAFLGEWKSSGIYPGGALAALNQQSCTPPVTGSTCTWTMTRNVFGIGLWTGQWINKPYPATNADPTDNPPGTGCNAAQATCFPSGSNYTNNFVNWNGGYLGDYHLANSSPYKGAGTDGADIGGNINLVNQFTQNVRANATGITAASVTSPATLPSGTHAVAYSYQMLGTSASDMQAWSITSGSLAACGLSMTRWGSITGASPVAGTCTFTVQIFDGAQQTASQAESITIN